MATDVKTMTVDALKKELRYLRWRVARYTRLSGRILETKKADGSLKRSVLPGPIEAEDEARLKELKDEIQRRSING